MRRYSEQEKAEALVTVERVGAKKASEQMGISYATILKWRKEAVSEPMDDTPPNDSVPFDGQAADVEYIQQDTESRSISLAEQVRMLQLEKAALACENKRLKEAITALISG